MTRIPFSSLKSFSRLFSDYTEHFDRLAPWFGADPDNPASLAADIAGDHPDRSALAGILRRQSAGWGLAEVSEPLITRLENPESVAVVTGQQLGLFGGPLYTLYKTLSAIRLAESMDRPAVAVFWLEGEDHDFNEVSSIGLLKGDDPVRLSYEAGETGGAVGRIVLREDFGALIDELEGVLQPTDFTADLVSVVRSAYSPGRTMTEAFVALVNRLVGKGRILFLSPDDAELKRLGADVFRREIEDPARPAGLLAQAGDALVEAGYHAQVTSRHTNLFLHTDSGRLAVDADAGSFRAGDQMWTAQELLNLLETEPGRFSPNVVLRPLLQDRVLPTAAYVAGPGEIAYFAQFKGLYDWAGIRMPVISPRASVTLLEGRVAKVLKRNELGVADFEDQVDKLFRRVVLDQLDVNLEQAFSGAASHLHEAINEIKPIVASVDASLVKTTEAVRAGFMKEWVRLEARVVKAEKDRHDVLRAQFDRASANLFPFGLPQERGLSSLYFLNKYGPDLIARLETQIDTDSRAHQILEL